MKTQLQLITHKLNQAFPDGRQPFQIMTRLLEEAGELATEVGHREQTGRKIEKLGPATQARLAAEAVDVMQVVAQLIEYYQLEDEVDQILAQRSQPDCQISESDW